jgi:hypothetical protein
MSPHPSTRPVMVPADPMPAKGAAAVRDIGRGGCHVRGRTWDRLVHRAGRRRIHTRGEGEHHHRHQRARCYSRFHRPLRLANSSSLVVRPQTVTRKSEHYSSARWLHWPAWLGWILGYLPDAVASETKIAPRSERIAACAGRDASSGIVASRVGGPATSLSKSAGRYPEAHGIFRRSHAIRTRGLPAGARSDARNATNSAAFPAALRVGLASPGDQRLGRRLGR